MRLSYGRLLPYIIRQWPKFLLIVVLTGAASLIAALEPLPLKLLVDYALGTEKLPAYLTTVAEFKKIGDSRAALVVLAAVASLGYFVSLSVVDALLSWAWMSAGQQMVYELSAALFQKLQRLSFAFHVRRPIGDSLSRLLQDTWSIYSLASSVMSPLQSSLTLVTIGLVAYRFDPQLAALSLALAPVLGLLAVIFGPRLKRRALDTREAESRLMSFVHQTLEAIPVVQAFGTEARNRQRFHAMANDAVTLSERGALLGGTYTLMTGLLLTTGAAVVLYVGGSRVLSGEMTVGTLLAFLVYMRTLQNNAETLLRTYSAFKPVEAGMDRVLEILEGEDDVAEAAEALPLPTRCRGDISIQHATFGYETGVPILQDVSLSVTAGETIAIVGASGAGKTTLVSLIPRFFDPWKGRVLLDGVDVRELQLYSLRAQVAVVLQEPFLFPLTIAENIAFGRPGAPRYDIEAAAEAANAHDFIRSLPQGYDTVIGPRGVTLSGGECQRLSIARALLKNAPILILDEPTSALDAATEASVVEAIENLMIGRTTFIVAHRLSTTRKADRIVVLDFGSIVEAGTHRTLLAERGLYHGLYSLHAGHQELIV